MSDHLRLEIDAKSKGKARVLVQRTTAEALHTVARHLRVPIDEVMRLGLSQLATKNGWTISWRNGTKKARVKRAG